MCLINWQMHGKMMLLGTTDNVSYRLANAWQNNASRYDRYVSYQLAIAWQNDASMYDR